MTNPLTQKRLAEIEARCVHYNEHTWGEPPLEPGENGTLHTEYQCKNAKGYFVACCDGDIDLCDLPVSRIKVAFARSRPDLIAEVKRLQEDYEDLESCCSKCGDSTHLLPTEKEVEIERLRVLVKSAHREGFAAIEGFEKYDADDYLWKHSESRKALLE